MPHCIEWGLHKTPVTSADLLGTSRVESWGNGFCIGVPTR